MRAGDVFIHEDESEKHWWVVISDPEIDATAFVVTVNFTSYAAHKDPSCILVPEDYPQFITHPTCVSYIDARPISLVVLRNHLSSGKIIKQKPVARAVLQKIRQGAAKSRHLHLGCRGILVEQGLI
jgi:hypothetical protein